VAGSGIRRKVDDLGRVVIPAGIRRTLNMREGDTVEVTVDGERVVLSKPRDACVFCGREDDTLQRFRGRLVCRECLGGLGDADQRLREAEAVVGRPDPPLSPAFARAAAAEPSPSPPATHGHRAEPPEPAWRSTDPRTSEPRAAEPTATEPPARWPTGPIDGDALARERERERAPSPRRPRRPPQDPASTTAW
jgi:AbrB family transcriptional regulator, transcriptional pleiotropic regulator of transition state genes